ncbi:ferritin-like domain-containing protein [Myxacorys almedinensis]|uniref:Ferritin-like domain-containing protein n=1 Tax=Myxacorys almedinensis A TaxID=2690445 RepID=A0A8J8CPQ3_9CYAN|nr:ferritin-like domain-containing protein [Myxacorys almedinensis]NDJ19802.1 ferritin-like domain-containing protein [Myxacorys almedinensis A]
MKPIATIAIFPTFAQRITILHTADSAFHGFCTAFRSLVLSTKLIAVSALLLFISLSIAPAAPAYAQGATLTPRQVVEYALTLEKLEADFYSRAVSAAQTGALMSVPQVAKDALVSYGQDEAQHVTDLSAVLRSIGGNPDGIMLPASPNYSAILGRDPFANPADLLLAGQYVEDLGVAAYKGQVQNLLAAGEAGKTILAAALAIHTVEARHAAGIRALRQTLLNADVRPWIRNASEVIYNENRQAMSSMSLLKQDDSADSVIPFSSEAFDGYATESEVLALVGPILMANSSTMEPTQMPNGSMSQPMENSTSEGVRALW